LPANTGSGTDSSGTNGPDTGASRTSVGKYHLP
jgi:hypothetical protein